MMKRIIALSAIASLICCGQVLAQDQYLDASYSSVAEGGLATGYRSNAANCYRSISQENAAGLWSGYCTSNCEYQGCQPTGLLRRGIRRSGGFFTGRLSTGSTMGTYVSPGYETIDGGLTSYVPAGNVPTMLASYGTYIDEEGHEHAAEHAHAEVAETLGGCCNDCGNSCSLGIGQGQLIHGLGTCVSDLGQTTSGFLHRLGSMMSQRPRLGSRMMGGHCGCGSPCSLQIGHRLRAGGGLFSRLRSHGEHLRGRMSGMMASGCGTPVDSCGCDGGYARPRLFNGRILAKLRCKMASLGIGRGGIMGRIKCRIQSMKNRLMSHSHRGSVCGQRVFRQNRLLQGLGRGGCCGMANAFFHAPCGYEYGNGDMMLYSSGCGCEAAGMHQESAHGVVEEAQPAAESTEQAKDAMEAAKEAVEKAEGK